jgi:prophage regulatory protein
MTEDRILRRPEVERLTGLSRATIYRQVQAGNFPAPIKLTARLIGWRYGVIAEWIQTRCG